MRTLQMQGVLEFGRHYVRDIVYAANDGLVTTFAVVAGVRGAELGPMVVLVLGFANLVADGLSMAVGDYLGVKSERAVELNGSFQEWPETLHAAKHGVVTWVASCVAGIIPLLPFVMAIGPESAFAVSVAFTAFALFSVGALRDPCYRARMVAQRPRDARRWRYCSNGRLPHRLGNCGRLAIEIIQTTAMALKAA